MKRDCLLGGVLILLTASTLAFAQRRKVSEEEFVRQPPAVGSKLPDLTVYDPQGNEVHTSRLRGHYTVLTFGCLT
jgi:cytochrome oxidase Cu insertion factor (SCO1/SenC/PrrC family)